MRLYGRIHERAPRCRGVSQLAKLLNGLYTAAFSLVIPLLLARLVWRGWHDRMQLSRWYERLGFYRGAPLAPGTIWVHAVSVGETMAAVPLIRSLQQAGESPCIVVTTTTATGAATVARTLGGSVRHVFFPYDVPWVLRRFMEHVRPRLLIILETELWPNTLAACKARAVPVILANARLSRRSLRGYRALAPLSRAVLGNIDRIAAQARGDAERFLELGAHTDQVQVTGSLKFDLIPPPSLHEQAEALRRVLGVNRPILMLGSTRDGEEALLLEALARLQDDFPHLLAIFAPRHPERFDQVTALCLAAGQVTVRFSAGGACANDVTVFVLDAMGELPRFYAAADIAFVGGSLLPFGGHNVLEPASLGVPVLVGPYTHNFAEICQLLREAGALTVVEDAAAFAAGAARWLRDSNERDRVGQAGREIVRRHRGATARTMDIIMPHLAPGHRPGP